MNFTSRISRNVQTVESKIFIIFVKLSIKSNVQSTSNSDWFRTVRSNALRRNARNPQRVRLAPAWRFSSILGNLFTSREPCGNHGCAVNRGNGFVGTRRSGRCLSYRGRNLASPKWLTRERINNDGGKVVRLKYR